jgi:RimJ/RimL family protein N-acetyltransferase
VKIPIGEWWIRSYESRDLDALLRYANNRAVSMHLRDAFPYPYRRRHAESWLGLALGQSVESHFAIATRKELIGGIGFQLQDDVYRKSAEIGYWVAQPFWGCGIATLAVGAMTRYAFSHFPLKRLFANVFEGNPASERVLQKSGYAYEGTMRKSVYKERQYRDQKIFALLREDWKRANP